MEFTGFHLQHQLQEESAQCTTSATPPDYKPSNSQSWIPSNIYNGCTNGFRTESFTHSRELGHKHGMIDSVRTSTVQAFGFHDGTKSFTQQQPTSDLLPARINDKRLSDDLPKLSELMKYRSSKAVNESCSLISISEPQYSPFFFSSCRVTGKEFLPAENFYHVQKPIYGGMALTKRYNFGGVSSISNLSTLDMTSSLVSCSLGLNSQMLDMHTNFSGSCGLQLCYDTFGLNEGISYSNIHGRENSPSKSSNKISSITSKVAMTKRPSNCSRSKESEAKAIKKSRPSCPPLKVRKEKLGDRIQTLQRLVAPFGKTSTASVLTEAIGYIHFLHEQIQTLSIPYMKSAQGKPFRMVQLDSKKVDSREFKPDLRSRGLCLVPLSCASYIHRCA